MGLSEFSRRSRLFLLHATTPSSYLNSASFSLPCRKSFKHLERLRPGSSTGAQDPLEANTPGGEEQAARFHGGAGSIVVVQYEETPVGTPSFPVALNWY